jgi:formylmethanofuran dehydrogenase subunit C
MNAHTLIWRGGASASAIDGGDLRPDLLARLDASDVARAPLGRSGASVGDYFRIESSSGSQGALIVRDAPPLDRLGARMAWGRLVVEGDAGDELGCAMAGGIITVRGCAGRRTGGPDPLPLPTPSDRGMSGGTVLIRGDAGDYTALRCRRGLIAVGGSLGLSPGCQMIGGTVLASECTGDGVGLHLRRGTLLFAGLPDADAWEPGEAYAFEAEVAAPVLPALAVVVRCAVESGWLPPEALRAGGGAAALERWHRGRLRVFRGDRHELNRGEVIAWVKPRA